MNSSVTGLVNKIARRVIGYILLSVRINTDHFLMLFRTLVLLCFLQFFFLTGMRLSSEQLNRKSVSPETIKKVTQLVNTYGFRYPKREQEGNESCTAPVLYCLASFKEFTYHSCKCDIKRIMFPPRHKALRCITNKKN